jgi:hypothetical protein
MAVAVTNSSSQERPEHRPEAVNGVDLVANLVSEDSHHDKGNLWRDVG